MDELVARIVAATGVSPATARNAAIIIFKFLLHDGPAGTVGPLVDRIPGARQAIAASALGGSGGVMGVFNDLTAAGLGMGEVQGAARAFLDYARETVGAAEVDAVVAGIPGLGQFV